MSDSQYLDVVGFVETKNGKKPRRIGRAKIESAELCKVWLDSIPAGNWDGSLLIQKRRDDQKPAASRDDDGFP